MKATNDLKKQKTFTKTKNKTATTKKVNKKIEILGKLNN